MTRRFEEKDADQVSKLIVRNFREVNSKDYGIAVTEGMAKVYDQKKYNILPAMHICTSLNGKTKS